MDIWIIRQGEKSGPFPDYEIRHKITSGELTAETPAWHEGLPGWTPISKLGIFKNDFSSPLPETPPGPVPPPLPPAPPPPLPERPRIARRFWARWLDLHLYAAVWWLAMWAAGRDIEAALMNPWIMIPHFVPWFILETLLIHRFATTPGKAILGLRVLNLDGSRLDLAASTRRSLRVLVAGIGFGWGLVAILCQGISLYTTRRLGSPLWDYLGQHQVASAPVGSFRIIAVILLFFTAIQLQMAVISPYVLKNAVESFPELKERLEKNPPWHLPPRHKPS